MVAGCGEIVGPGKMPELDRIPAGDAQRLVARAGIDQDDLIDASDERSKAIFDECRFVADDQRR
jgi:hypothetical protein